MTEKRFECDSQDVQFSMVEDGELILVNPSYVVNLLNSLQKENEQLKDDLKCLLQLIEDTPIEHSLYVQKIKERWEND